MNLDLWPLVDLSFRVRRHALLIYLSFTAMAFRSELYQSFLGIFGVTSTLGVEILTASQGFQLWRFRAKVAVLKGPVAPEFRGDSPPKKWRF